ncbi:MAG: TonB-dependent receptor [Chlorobi bacterium]|nr:TonB-dependent receptor [Chlorobiota bacterium]
MDQNNLKLKIIVLFLIMIVPAPLSAQAPDTLSLEEILIKGTANDKLLQTNISAETIKLQDVHDVGEMFKTQPGIGIVKRGNYAMEPVIRGFKYGEINIQIDGGTKTSNACPNRMDPAISQVSPEEVEKAEVIKGPYQVRFGPSLGGTINVVTENPEKTDHFKVKGSAGGGYMSNGNNFYGQADLQLLSKDFDVSLHADYKNFGNYKSGNGTTIPSSYSRFGYSVKLGNNHGKNKQNRIQLTLRQGYAKNILYAGLPMDADKDNSTLAYVDYMARDVSDLIFLLKAKIFASYVDHEMSTRKRPSWNYTEAVAPVTSRSFGGRFEFGLKPSGKLVGFAGMDFNYTNKDGQRNRLVKINGCTGDTLPVPKHFVDLIWQDSKISDMGIFYENKYQITSRLLWVAGIRFDFVGYAIDNPAPDFKELYNNDIQPDEDYNISVNTSLTWQFNPGFYLQWAMGRGVRSAGLSEKFINHLSIGEDAYEYVGNPHLKPEVNYQTDFIVNKKWETVRIYVDVFYSFLDNYISAYVDTTLKKKFMPCKPPPNAKRFTNIKNAMMTGFEAGIDVFFAKYFRYSLSGGYTYAQNISREEPLPEIPPFTVNTLLGYNSQKVMAEVRIRFSAAQNRISAGFSETATPGFTVVDLAGSYVPVQWFEIRASVTNLLNRNYVEHLSRAYKNMGPETGSLYYEPGISFNIGVTVKF